MEALGQLLSTIAEFIFEVTIHAVVFVFHLVMALFSRRYRGKLREDWDASAWRRTCIVLGVAMYSAALILALLFWIPALSRHATASADTEDSPSEKTESGGDDIRRMKNTKENMSPESEGRSR